MIPLGEVFYGEIFWILKKRFKEKDFLHVYDFFTLNFFTTYNNLSKTFLMTYILAHYSKLGVQTHDDGIFLLNGMIHTFTRDIPYSHGYSQKC